MGKTSHVLHHRLGKAKGADCNWNLLSLSSPVISLLPILAAFQDILQHRRTPRASLPVPDRSDQTLPQWTRTPPQMYAISHLFKSSITLPAQGCTINIPESQLMRVSWFV